MSESVGKIEAFLWETVINTPEVIGAAWVVNGKIRARALRNDFDTNFLLYNLRFRVSSRPFSVRYDLGYIAIYPVGSDEYIILETTVDIIDVGGNLRPPHNPYIFINPNFDYGVA